MTWKSNSEFEGGWVVPAVRMLEQAYGCKSAAVLFVRKAKQVFQQAKLNGPPFDPREYARNLRIRVKEKELMAVDGMLTRSEEGVFEVILKKECGYRRKNFTLAHEIAHTFFYSDLEEFAPKARGASSYDNEEERLCNLAAAELLMPFPFFRRDLVRLSDNGTITPRTVLQLTDMYDVSLRAAAIRLTSVKKGVVCALWKPQGKAANLEWVTPPRFKRLITCHTHGSSIMQAFEKPGQIVTNVDRFYQQRNPTLRRKTSSLKLPSGAVLSVLQPISEAQPSVTSSADRRLPEFRSKSRQLKHISLRSQSARPRQLAFAWLDSNDPPERVGQD